MCVYLSGLSTTAQEMKNNFNKSSCLLHYQKTLIIENLFCKIIYITADETIFVK